jgi:hypothetical protein
MPGFLRSVCIQRLTDCTAASFGVRPPHISSVDDYAAFTAEQAMLASSGSEERLFSSAHALGVKLRARLGIRSHAEAMVVARALYRMIGVDFKPDAAGGFIVSSCFFSSCYSPSICRLISSLDAGLLCGLSGRKEMTFTQRITEGAGVCRGVIR